MNIFYQSSSADQPLDLHQYNSLSTSMVVEDLAFNRSKLFQIKPYPASCLLPTGHSMNLRKTNHLVSLSQYCKTALVQNILRDIN
jgi:hypothetical protein